MPTTRRRKIARRSVAIRRVKPNTKRKERKTQKRKPRNIVMRGGVHNNFNVYVIQKKLEKPKCVIIRQKSRMSKDTIYLFFESNMEPTEIKEFVYAAMGLDAGAVIEPELHFTSSKDNFNNLFVKLSGNVIGYSLSSGNLYGVTGVYISQIQVQKHDTTPNIEKKNGQAIIDSLKSKTLTMEDCTFSEVTQEGYFNYENFYLGELNSLFNLFMRDTNRQLNDHCPELISSEKIAKLKNMVNQQTNLLLNAPEHAHDFVLGRGLSKDKDEDKQLRIAELKKAGYDFSEAANLINDIQRDMLYKKCKGLIDSECLKYIEGTKKFKSVEDIVTDAYDISF
jgi:hypothetical protein